MRRCIEARIGGTEPADSRFSRTASDGGPRRREGIPASILPMTRPASIDGMAAPTGACITPGASSLQDPLSSPEPSTQSAPTPLLPRQHLAFGTFLATGAVVAPLVAAAAISLVIARLYGPSRTGVLSLALNLFDVVLMIFTLGLSAGITYLVSRGEWPLRRAFREMWLTAFALGVAGAACGIGFYLLTRNTILKGVAPALAIVPLASLPFAIGWAFSAATALGRHRYLAYASFEIGNALVLLIAGVVLAVLFGPIGAIVGICGCECRDGRGRGDVVAAGVQERQRDSRRRPSIRPCSPPRNPVWTPSLVGESPATAQLSSRHLHPQRGSDTVRLWGCTRSPYR